MSNWFFGLRVVPLSLSPSSETRKPKPARKIWLPGPRAAIFSRGFLSRVARRTKRKRAFSWSTGLSNNLTVYIFYVIFCAVIIFRLGYVSIGCHKDTASHAVPLLEGQDSIPPYWVAPIVKCAVAARCKLNHMFSVQHGDQCFSSATASAENLQLVGMAAKEDLGQVEFNYFTAWKKLLIGISILQLTKQ